MIIFLFKKNIFAKKMKLSKDIALRYKIYFPLLFMFFVFFIVYAFITKDNLFYLWISISLVFFILYVIISIRKPHYFYLETTYNQIIIRFFNPHPLLRRNKAIQIPNNKFAGYEITEKMNGFVKLLTVKIKDNKKVLSYPPISITLLKNHEIDAMKKEFDTILKINRL